MKRWCAPLRLGHTRIRRQMMKFTKEEVTLTVTTRGGYGKAHTFTNINLDWWLDRQFIINLRRDGNKVVVNRYLS